MKLRTESTAKTGARRCEFWGGRGDCEGNVTVQRPADSFDSP